MYYMCKLVNTYVQHIVNALLTLSFCVNTPRYDFIILGVAFSSTSITLTSLGPASLYNKCTNVYMGIQQHYCTLLNFKLNISDIVINVFINMLSNTHITVQCTCTS